MFICGVLYECGFCVSICLCGWVHWDMVSGAVLMYNFMCVCVGVWVDLFVNVYVLVYLWFAMFSPAISA